MFQDMLRSWRVVDMVFAAVLGVAFGILLVVINWLDGPLATILDIFPGASGLLMGLYVIGGVLGGLMIRRLGAPLLVAILGGLIESVISVKWGWMNLLYSLVQGLAAEIVFFALFIYAINKPLGRIRTVLSGALAGMAAVAAGTGLYAIVGGFSKLDSFYVGTYFSTALIGGLIGGGLCWVILVALRQAGALKALGQSPIKLSAKAQEKAQEKADKK